MQKKGPNGAAMIAALQTKRKTKKTLKENPQIKRMASIWCPCFFIDNNNLYTKPIELFIFTF